MGRNRETNKYRSLKMNFMGYFHTNNIYIYLSCSLLSLRRIQGMLGIFFELTMAETTTKKQPM